MTRSRQFVLPMIVASIAALAGCTSDGGGALVKLGIAEGERTKEAIHRAQDSQDTTRSASSLEQAALRGETRNWRAQGAEARSDLARLLQEQARAEEARAKAETTKAFRDAEVDDMLGGD